MSGDIDKLHDDAARELMAIPSDLSQRVKALAAAIRGTFESENATEPAMRVRWRRALRAAAIENPLWQTTVRRERLDFLDAIDLAVDDLDPARQESHGLSRLPGEPTQHFSPRDLTRMLLAEPTILGALLNDIPIAVWIYDVEGRPITMNAAAVEVIGGTTHDAHGVTLREESGPKVELLRPDGSAYLLEDYPIIRAIRGEATVNEEIIIRSSWRSGMYLINTTPLRDETGQILATVSTAQEIGELKRLEAELAATTNQLGAILDHSPVMILRFDPEGRCDFVNQTWLDFRGRLAEQEVGFGWLEGVHPQDLYQSFQQYWDAFAGQKRFEWTARLRRHDGVYRWIAGRVVPYHDHREFGGYLASCFDVTERIEYQGLLLREQRTAVESTRTKSRMLRAFSHDLRLPLNSISISTDLLMTHVEDPENAEVIESEESIRRSLDNVVDLLNATLDLARIESGALPVEVTPFALEDALIECLASVQSAARKKGLQCGLEPMSNTSLIVSTDRAKLKQIVSNLLSNAVHYTDAGSVVVRAVHQSGDLWIEVEDTGVGIAENDLPRIFEEYTRLAGSTRQRREGSGLGLAIARSLAQLLGGTLTVTSELGVGSTFRLAFPDWIVSVDESELTTGRIWLDDQAPHEKGGKRQNQAKQGEAQRP